MANWIRFDPIVLLDEFGCVKNLKEMPPEIRRCLTSPIQVVELFQGKGVNRVKIGEIKSVYFQNKSHTAEMFLKKFGAFIDNKKITIEDLSYLDEILSKIKK